MSSIITVPNANAFIPLRKRQLRRCLQATSQSWFGAEMTQRLRCWEDSDCWKACFAAIQDLKWVQFCTVECGCWGTQFVPSRLRKPPHIGMPDQWSKPGCSAWLASTWHHGRAEKLAVYLVRGWSSISGFGCLTLTLNKTFKSAEPDKKTGIKFLTGLLRTLEKASECC